MEQIRLWQPPRPELRPTIDAAFERATEASEQFAAASRKASNLYLDSYEKAVDRAIELELKLAGATQRWLEPDRGPGGLHSRLTNSYWPTAPAFLK